MFSISYARLPSTSSTSYRQDRDLAGAEVELVALPERERRLGRALEAVTGAFDYVFLDCPPAVGLLTVNALAAADAVLVPIQCEYYALEG
jgi:chromosome partitioning protein